MNESVLVRSDKQWILAVHIVDWHGQIRFSYLLEGSVLLPSPEFDTCIPATTYNHRLLRRRLNYISDVLDGLAVLTKTGHLLC